MAVPLAAVAAIAVVFLPLWPSDDLDVFLRAGHSVLHGLRVYPIPGSRAVYSGSSFVYPYFAVLPFVGLAAIGSSAATTLFFVLSALAVLCACFAGPGGDSWRATLVLCTTFTITGLQLGSLSPLLFAGSVLLWQLRDRPLALALIAGPLVASKLFLAPLLIWLLLARRYRAFAWASASVLLLLAISFTLGPISPARYARLLSALGSHEARSGFGLVGVLVNAGLAAAAAQACGAGLAAGLLGAAYVHYRRSRSQAEGVLFCAGIVASLAMTPVLWSHYLVLLPAALVVLNAPRRWFVVLALCSWAIALPHGVQLDTDEVIEGVSSSSTWLAVASALALLGYATRQTRTPRRAPGPQR